jgi:hypothetical protein
MSYRKCPHCNTNSVQVVIDRARKYDSEDKYKIVIDKRQCNGCKTIYSVKFSQSGENELFEFLEFIDEMYVK